MRWSQLEIDGVWAIDPNPVFDARGWFARMLDVDELRERGLADVFPQSNAASNTRAGTVRGLHLQRGPAAEVKIVRCTRGALFDVIVDARRESRTFGKTVGVRLDDRNNRTLYVPTGCAHGYQTLLDDTELCYSMSAVYAPELADGVRWNDPQIRIDWPLAVSCISDRDMALGTFADLSVRVERMETSHV